MDLSRICSEKDLEGRVKRSSSLSTSVKTKKCHPVVAVTLYHNDRGVSIQLYLETQFSLAPTEAREAHLLAYDENAFYHKRIISI